MGCVPRVIRNWSFSLTVNTLRGARRDKSTSTSQVLLSDSLSSHPSRIIFPPVTLPQSRSNSFQRVFPSWILLFVRGLTCGLLLHSSHSSKVKAPFWTDFC